MSSAPKYQILLRMVKKLELPMLFLSFVWLCILIIELVYGITPVLSYLGTCIWILFIFYFTMRLVTVENRIAFLKKNRLFVLAILVSVLRFVPYLQSFPNESLNPIRCPNRGCASASGSIAAWERS